MLSRQAFAEIGLGIILGFVTLVIVLQSGMQSRIAGMMRNSRALLEVNCAIYTTDEERASCCAQNPANTGCQSSSACVPYQHPPNCNTPPCLGAQHICDYNIVTTCDGAVWYCNYTCSDYECGTGPSSQAETSSASNTSASNSSSSASNGGGPYYQFCCDTINNSCYEFAGGQREGCYLLQSMCIANCPLVSSSSTSANSSSSASETSSSIASSSEDSSSASSAGMELPSSSSSTAAVSSSSSIAPPPPPPPPPPTTPPPPPPVYYFACTTPGLPTDNCEVVPPPYLTTVYPTLEACWAQATCPADSSSSVSSSAGNSSSSSSAVPLHFYACTTPGSPMTNCEEEPLPSPFDVFTSLPLCQQNAVCPTASSSASSEGIILPPFSSSSVPTLASSYSSDSGTLDSSVSSSVTANSSSSNSSAPTVTSSSSSTISSSVASAQSSSKSSSTPNITLPSSSSSRSSSSRSSSSLHSSSSSFSSALSSSVTITSSPSRSSSSSRSSSRSSSTSSARFSSSSSSSSAVFVLGASSSSRSSSISSSLSAILSSAQSTSSSAPAFFAVQSSSASSTEWVLLNPPPPASSAGSPFVFIGQIFGPEDQPSPSAPDWEAIPNGSPDTSPGTTQPPKEILCGNGRLDSKEECDDGNVKSGDGCTAKCKLERGFCGDGKMQTSLGEQCDAGKAKNGKEGVDCDTLCFFPPVAGCGDGKVNQAMELCDAGKRNADVGGAPCRTNCMLPTCGDGILDSKKEQCDDRNLLNGDGCSSKCRKEIAIPIPVIADTRPAAELLPAHIPTPARTPTGPGLVIFLASGAAAGWGATRKKRP